jgi:hypothetical protein
VSKRERDDFLAFVNLANPGGLHDKVKSTPAHLAN